MVHVSWPMRSWCQLANEKHMSNGQWEAYVKWPMRSWFQMANKKLMSFGQWEADVKWPMKSLCFCHNLFYCLSICWHLEIVSVFIASIDHFDLVFILPSKLVWLHLHSTFHINKGQRKFCINMLVRWHIWRELGFGGDITCYNFDSLSKSPALMSGVWMWNDGWVEGGQGSTDLRGGKQRLSSQQSKWFNASK